MKKIAKEFLVLIMVLMLSMTVISNSNIITAEASTEVSIESTENKSFFERLKEKREQRKKDNEKKKQVKELNKKIKKAKKYLNEKKYNDVLQILKPELDKDIDVSEAKLLCDMVEYYMEATEDFNNSMYETAKDKLNAIDASYEDYEIKEDIEKLMANIEEKLAYKEEINMKITEISTLIDEKKLQTAKSKINELASKCVDDEQKQRLIELESTVDLMIEEEKKAEEEKRKQEELKRQQEIDNKKTNSSNSSGSNNSSSSSASAGGTTYYIAAGNRYYHKTLSCKFLDGAATTATSNVSNKFACNCVKYN